MTAVRKELLEIDAAEASGDTAAVDAMLRQAVASRGSRIATLSPAPVAYTLSPDTERKLREANGKWATRVQVGVAALLQRCESPVERLFLLAAVGHHQSDMFDAGTRRRFASASGLIVACEVLDGAALFALQVPAGDYRLDFAIVPEAGEVGLAIEVDGHAFHETKAAAAADKRRDRALSAAGWTVCRFTAAEVWADADRCFAEALQVFGKRVR